MSAPAAAARVPAARSLRRPVDKFDARRDELAAATRTTLAELGYAQTSLREIAANTDYSHGVLHYYFRDKVDLITHSVRQYKAECVTRYDALVADAVDADGLARAFGAAMAETAVVDADMHRLWYDLRNQAMFTPAFIDDVRAIDAGLQAMISRVVGRYSELCGAPSQLPEATTYALFDGLFLQALGRVSTEPGAPASDLAASVAAVLRCVVA
ncbi:MAG: TetR/AcrR family transcriptional regulator [Sporichthyaceae bacterium]